MTIKHIVWTRTLNGVLNFMEGTMRIDKQLLEYLTNSRYISSVVDDSDYATTDELSGMFAECLHIRIVDSKRRNKRGHFEVVFDGYVNGYDYTRFYYGDITAEDYLKEMEEWENKR